MKTKKYFKRFAGLLVLGVILGLMPATALADTPTQVVSMDVGAQNKNDEYCRIDDKGIWLKRTDVVYELSGSTDKPIELWTPGDNPTDAQKRIYVRLNNVTVNGGIKAITPPVGIILEVPAGTVNNFGPISASNISISGSGTLNATYLNISQFKSNMPRALNISDTTVNVRNADGYSSYWNGSIVLGGNADVTIVGNGMYPVLNIGENDDAAGMILQENASLKCLQDDIDTPAAARVSGISLYNNGSTLLMKDNSYLEAEGKASTTAHKGFGIISDGSVTVQDNATLKATGHDYALIASNIIVNGGTVIANSKESLGIYAPDAISISNGASVTASGTSPAIQSNNIAISNSAVNAVSSNGIAIYSTADVTITNSIVAATSTDGQTGIQSDGTASVSGSWIHTSGNEDFENHIEDSVLINKTAGTVIGNHTLPGDATIPAGTTLTFPDGTSLSVPSGVTLTIKGTIDGSFDITNNGTVICNGHVGGTATCGGKAVCEICGKEYGEINADHHTGFTKIDAKAATHLAIGNVEHYICNGCGKYFGDAAGTREISQTETIIPKTLAHTVDDTGLHADESGHWNTCACGIVLNKFDHVFKWIIDKEATADENGGRHEECTVCGYKMASVEIPATGTSAEPGPPGGDSDQPGNADTNPDDSDNQGGSGKPGDAGDQGGSGKPGDAGDQGGSDKPGDTGDQGGSGNIGSTQTQPGQTHAPQTGDGGSLVPWMALLLVNGTVLAMTAMQRKKPTCSFGVKRT